MGGGDLNMKKHFHPLTMENLERVWKAEQRHKQEMKKIEERKKEIEEERSKQSLLDQATSSGVMKKQEERLEWMYSANRANSEEFLLGKEVTNEYLDGSAYLEQQQQQQQEEAEKKRVFGFRGVQSSVIDLERKIKEDPLFLIKKRELAATKELINNSVRIQQMVNTSVRKTGETPRYGSGMMTPGATPLNRKSWDTPAKSSRDKFKTPRRYERRDDYSERSERRNTSSHPYKSGGDSASRRAGGSSNARKSGMSEREKEEKLKQMMSNAQWRESSRKSTVDKIKKEEELDRKLEEKMLQLRSNKLLSTPSSQKTIFEDAKMGQFSSRRYVKK